MQLYTPWMAQAGKTIGDAYTKNRQNKLYSSAYMGEQGAMEQLMQVNPAMAAQLQQQKQKAEQLKLQQSAAIQKRKQESINRIGPLLEKEEEAISKFETLEEANAYLSRRYRELSQTNPELAEAMGNEPLDKEHFEQARSIHGDDPDKAKYQQGTGKLAGYVFNPETGKYSVNQEIRDTLNSITPDQVVDAKTRLQINKDLTTLTKDTKLIRNTAKDLDGLSKIKSGPASIAMIFKFMKALDPTSVVREGEFATAENSAGIPEALRNTYNKVMSGGRLGDIQSAQFVDAAKRLANSAIESSNSEITNFLNTFEDTLPKGFKDALQKRIPQPFELEADQDGKMPELPKGMIDNKDGTFTQADGQVVRRKKNG